MKRILFILLFIPTITFAQINLGVDVGFPTSYTYYGNGSPINNSLIFPSLNFGLNVGYRIKYFLEPTLFVNYVGLNDNKVEYKKNINISVGIRGAILNKPLTPIYRVGLGYNLSTVNYNYTSLPGKYKSNNFLIQYGIGLQYSLKNNLAFNFFVANYMTAQKFMYTNGDHDNVKYYYIVPSVGVTYLIPKKGKK